MKQSVPEKLEDVSDEVPPAGVPFFLKALVIGMGVLLVGGVGIVLSTIIYRSVKVDNGAIASAQTGKLMNVAPVMLDIAPGSVRNIAVDGNRVAVQTDNEIILIDVRRHRMIGRIKLNGSKPSN